MRYGIFADIHSNLEAFESVIAAYKNESIDQYLCVGDIVGYAANPNECLRIVNALAAVSVAGNHDWASVDLFPSDYFNPVAKEAVFWTKRNLDKDSVSFLSSLKLIYQNEELSLVHSSLNDPKDFLYMFDEPAAKESLCLLTAKVCFVGHTHIAGAFIQDMGGRIDYRQADSFDIEEENKYIINVGSIGQPRDHDPKAAYCVYDSSKKKVEIKRIDYNIDSTRKKIIDAGLPHFLGDRLLIGR
jgi:predicted phosphodiesterase